MALSCLGPRTASRRRSERPRSGHVILSVVAAFAVTAVVATWPLVLHFGDSIPGNLGDPLLNAWILAWGAGRLLHGLRGLWDAPIFHPYDNTLAYGEHLLGITIFTAPIQWLTGNAVVAYNTAILGSFVLAGVGMYLLTAHLTGSRTAGLVAGVVFAFLPYRADQISHLQVLMYGWMPISLWGMHRYFQTGRRAPLAVFVAAFLLTGFSNGYFFYFLAVAVIVVAGVEVLAHVRSRPRILVDLAVAVVVMAAVVAPVASVYHDAKNEQNLSRSRSEIVSLSADALSYFHAAQGTIWDELLPGDRPETRLFPGLTVLVLAVVGLGARHRTVAVYVTVGAAGFVLSLGPEPSVNGTVLTDSGPYNWLLSVVPGLDGIRVAARASILVFLSLAVLAAFGVRWLLDRLPCVVGWTVCLAAACAIAVEGFHQVPMVAFETPPETRAVYRWLRERPPGAVFELPFYSRGYGVEQTIRYMHGTLEHGHPLVNGWNGYASPLHHRLVGSNELYVVQNYDSLLRELREFGVRYVLLHGGRFSRAWEQRWMLNAILRQRDQLLAVHRIGETYIVELRARDVHGDE